MPHYKIVSRWDAARVLYEGEAETLRDLVGTAVKGCANLYGADLYGANLRGADLYGANLRCADLYGADLYGADLYGANLGGADLYGANLRGADLRGANLRGANLYGANLGGANLYGANLGGADLYGANLRGADLYGANLGAPGKLRLSWSSHALLSEILWLAAGDSEPRQMLAAYVGRRTDWCWDRWSTWEHPDREWALRELARWIHADEDDVPECVRAAKEVGS